MDALTGTLFGDDPKAFAHVMGERDGAIVGIAISFLTYSTWTDGTECGSRTSTSTGRSAVVATGRR